MIKTVSAIALIALIGALAVSAHPVHPVSPGTRSGVGLPDEEFIGPFPNWINAKTGKQVDGTGSTLCTGAAASPPTDDAAAIQSCLDQLGSSHPVLWFPAGTYQINTCLHLGSLCNGSSPVGIQYISLIGADPATTTIKWGGSAGGTMLFLGGVAYSRFDRLTFDGNNSAAIAVDQSKPDSPTNYFDTVLEYADDVFKNAGIGLQCGALGFGCADVAILRNKFINNTVAGVSLGNFNALGVNIWFSDFQNNFEGVTNSHHAGNFNVLNSKFSGSANADVNISNTGVFGIRNNYSLGSFIFSQGSTSNSPNPAAMQANTILDTTYNGANLSVYLGNVGPLGLFDNVIRSRADVTSGAIAEIQGLGQPADIFSIGGTFTTGSGNCVSTAPVFVPLIGRCFEVGDQVVSRSTVTPSAPILPSTPPQHCSNVGTPLCANNDRTIYEVATTGSGSACTAAAPCASVQQAITNASNAEIAGAIHPVVHIQSGNYSIAATATVPATSRSGIQIIGDGFFSALNWSVGGAGPVLRLTGPSKAILRDFVIDGNNNVADGLEVTSADQIGSHVFMEQPYLTLSKINMFVDALDRTNVELHNFYHNNTAVHTGTSSLKVTGGPSAAGGTWLGGSTNVFGGDASGNNPGYDVSAGAHLLVRDAWYDAGAGGGQIANGTGVNTTFTFAASALYAGTGANAIVLNDFKGVAALANLSTNSAVNITGDATGAKILALGMVGPTSTFYSNTATGSPTVDFVENQTTCSGGGCSLPGGAGSIPIANTGGCCGDTAFLTTTLAQYRGAVAGQPVALPANISDVRVYRVSVSNALTGVHLKN